MRASLAVIIATMCLAFFSGAAYAQELKMPAEEKVIDKAKEQNSCIACHREMGGEMAKPVIEWEKSYHKEMGNSCEGCHGGDPNIEGAESMDPERGFVGSPASPSLVPEFCGKCHVGVRENYVKSDHYQSVLDMGEPNCTTCHGSHNIQRASFEIITEERCTQCHSYDNARMIKKSFVSAEIKIEELEEDIEEVRYGGMGVKGIEDRLFAIRNSLHQLTHVLDIQVISDKNKDVLVELGEISKVVSTKKDQIKSRKWLAQVVAGFCFFTVAVLLTYLKVLRDEHEDGSNN